MTDLAYNITTVCIGKKYEPLKPDWLQRLEKMCKKMNIHIWSEIDSTILKYGLEEAWWDVVRLKRNLELLMKEKKPVMHLDMDMIVEKDLIDIVNLPYDFIISTEIGGPNAYPKECSNKLGFGICSGLYVIKPSAMKFMLTILKNMMSYTFNCYSDQVNIMNYIIKNPHQIVVEEVVLGEKTYKNNIVLIDGIKIGVLDFAMVIRDPILNNGQYANHINIDNVGGVVQFKKYFYADLETLPLTCRCGKKHLGDTTVCKHLAMRQLKNM